MVLFQKTRQLVKKVHNAVHSRENSLDDLELANPVDSFQSSEYSKNLVTCITPSHDEFDKFNYNDTHQGKHHRHPSNLIDTPPLTPTAPSFTMALTTHTGSSTSLPSLEPLVSSQKVDDNFPVQDYTKWEAQHGQSACQDCLICTRRFCPGDQIREMPCSSTLPHIFHSSCLFDWLTQSHLSCPTCDRRVL
ncbi:hypothetical protein CJU90_5687 [Yarrowia sp. C11]|nr:hypothetical protein CJU90_5687 [Yarrowia sp. C11]KAG5364271.1 hypothetical protein CKK34_3065 [Yarrowia sp. E02]